MDSAEEKLMNDEIESVTYKKWYKKYMFQKSTPESEIQALQKDYHYF